MIPHGFIFDLDGVLVDTARCHYLAWKALADEMGLCFTKQDNHLLKGVSRQRSLEIILERNRALERFSTQQRKEMAQKKNENYVRMIGQLTPADVLPGIPEFLAQAREKGIRLAVASASRNAAAVLQRLELTPVFDYVADAAHISNPKPHPEVFLSCAHALGLEPGACVGFEDAQAGIEAIHAAGMLAVGINVQVTSQKPDIILHSTSELDVKRLLNDLMYFEKQGV